MIRTLIVDDEHYAREELRQQLACDPAIEIVGEAANAIEALRLFNASSPTWCSSISRCPS